MRSSDAVEYQVRGRITLLLIDRPPVNAIDAEVRAGLIRGIHRAEADDAVDAIVLACAGRTFIAGADLDEIDSGIQEPSYEQTLAALENCAKPVVAALHGTALGGGVEVAIACHYRVATPATKLGMPEITLGIVPGAGGTQRLPRLIGPVAALRLLVSGAPVDAAEGLKLGLLDAVVDGEAAAIGLEFARKLVTQGAGPRPTAARAVVAMEWSEELAASLLRANAKTLQGRSTQHRLVEAIQAAVTLPFESGLKAERGLAHASIASPESKALRHMFFAERGTGKIPGVGKDIQPRSLRRVAIVGAGTMGSGIAIACNDAGYQVTLVDARREGLERGQQFIRANYASNAKRGRMTVEQAEAAATAIGTTLELARIADADLVIEAVFEDMELKKQLLRDIRPLVAERATLASNTSSLSVTELGEAVGSPERVLGLHFFSPAHIMRLLEIVRGERTSTETLVTGLEFGKKLKKVPVLAGDGFGFIGNRMMLDGAYREAEQMMLEGAAVDQIDRAVEAFGFAMGPSRVNDMAGVDVGTRVREQLLRRAIREDPYCVVSDALTPLGRTGQKTGKGFYDYTVDPRNGRTDPQVTALIESLAKARGTERRSFTDDEIVERFVLQLVNVGAQVLEEKVAYRAADIDVVWVHGYGFPRHLGGPMFYADSLGLAHVLERIRHWHRRLGGYWKPAALLERLVLERSSFADMDRRASA